MRNVLLTAAAIVLLCQQPAKSFDEKFFALTQKLATQSKWEFPGNPLDDVLEYVQGIHGFEIDSRLIDKAGISLDVEIKAVNKGLVSEMLTEVLGPVDIEYLAKDGKIVLIPIDKKRREAQLKDASPELRKILSSKDASYESHDHYLAEFLEYLAVLTDLTFVIDKKSLESAGKSEKTIVEGIGYGLLVTTLDEFLHPAGLTWKAQENRIVIQAITKPRKGDVSTSSIPSDSESDETLAFKNEIVFSQFFYEQADQRRRQYSSLISNRGVWAFRKTSLQDILHEVSQTHDVDLILNYKAIEESGLSLDEVITYSGAGTIASMLSELLEQSKFELIADDDRILIWPQDQKERKRQDADGSPALKSKLDREVNIRFNGHRIEDCIWMIRTNHHMKILWDSNLLRDIERSIDSKIHRTMYCTMRTCLTEILSPAGLTWKAQGDRILIQAEKVKKTTTK